MPPARPRWCWGTSSRRKGGDGPAWSSPPKSSGEGRDREGPVPKAHHRRSEGVAGAAAAGVRGRGVCQPARPQHADGRDGASHDPRHQPGDGHVLGDLTLELHGDHGGILGGPAVQPDPADLRAGRVPHVPAGEGGGAAPRALPQDRRRSHDLVPAGLRDHLGEVRRGDPPLLSRLAEGIPVAEGQDPERGGPAAAGEAEGAAGHRRAPGVHPAPARHRSFRSCRLPSSTRSIASWATNPTARRTTDPKRTRKRAARCTALAARSLAYALLEQSGECGLHREPDAASAESQRSHPRCPGPSYRFHPMWLEHRDGRRRGAHQGEPRAALSTTGAAGAARGPVACVAPALRVAGGGGHGGGGGGASGCCTPTRPTTRSCSPACAPAPRLCPACAAAAPTPPTWRRHHGGCGPLGAPAPAAGRGRARALPPGEGGRGGGGHPCG
ncbi:voltage-gated potassium channel subunit beta-2 isoform X1 [Ciconia boyciana]|uniref:voltage-gated potassium channel subunit beta-2 isoform X1 n=1 Tax=Ciconia boyciana TaxID=52775 RepID=UPI003BA39B2C